MQASGAKSCNLAVKQVRPMTAIGVARLIPS